MTEVDEGYLLCTMRRRPARELERILTSADFTEHARGVAAMVLAEKNQRFQSYRDHAGADEDDEVEDDADRRPATSPTRRLVGIAFAVAGLSSWMGTASEVSWRDPTQSISLFAMSTAILSLGMFIAFRTHRSGWFAIACLGIMLGVSMIAALHS